MRLHIHYPSNITELGKKLPFVEPTLVDEWKIYLDDMLPVWALENDSRNHVLSNLSYSLQYLEITCALLLEHQERQIRGEQSSLHITVEKMMTLQFCVFACSILEGIGSYLYRYSKRENKKPKWNSHVKQNEWKEVLSMYIQPDKNNKISFDKKLQMIINLRNEVHLDTVGEKTNFNLFTYKKAFLPAHQCLGA